MTISKPDVGEQGFAAAPAVPSAHAGPTPGAAAPGVGETTRWQTRYAALVRTTDIAVVVIGVLVGIAADDARTPEAYLAHVTSGMSAGALLILGLPMARGWEPRILGYGATEFKRLSHSVIGSAMVLALVGVAFTVVSVRPWVLLAIPSIGLTLVAGRFTLRKWLHHQRRQGRCLLPVLAVGSDDAVADLIVRTTRDRHFGWTVTGVCTASGRAAGGDGQIAQVPVIGDLNDVARLACSGDYRVVAVSPAPGWSSPRLRRLAWDLESTAVELAVHPGLMEIAGPRLHIDPVDGMPLLRLTEPRFTGLSRLLKLVVDRACAALLLVALSPLLAAIAVAVRLDGGPALYRQYRVGVHGRAFRMVKFRSMVSDADRRLAELAEANDGHGPLFKMRHDPRVTRVGALLRRHSLDELPQLFNVLAGSMSLVGPRPPLPREVTTYGLEAKRRLLVRPGMTGLWQISGRSDLTWEESVRLDLRYVENWSLSLDAEILWKTLGAVVRGHGAY